MVSTSVSAPATPDPESGQPRPSGPVPGEAKLSGSAQLREQAMRRERLVKRSITMGSGLVFTGLLLLLIRIQGQVTGLEFSPTHFQQRSFRFFEIPLIHLQITPIQRSALTPGTANYLRINSLIQTPNVPPTTWHLVSISRGLTGTTPGDAQLLLDHLNLEAGGDQYWRKWSINHPQQAVVLWPIVQRLALRELYLLLPPLFEIAQRGHDSDELRASIDTHLQQEYITLIQNLRSAERDDLADQILAEAIDDYPDDERLIALRWPDAD